MTLSLKLPLAFAQALGLLFSGGMFGISRLNASLNVYENKVLSTVAASKDAESATLLAMVVMVAGAMLGMAGGIWLNRQIVLPLARAVELADKVGELGYRQCRDRAG